MAGAASVPPLPEERARNACARLEGGGGPSGTSWFETRRTECGGPHHEVQESRSWIRSTGTRSKGGVRSNGIRDRHDRACPGHPRLACGTKDVDARDEPAQDGYKRGGLGRGSTIGAAPDKPVMDDQTKLRTRKRHQSSVS